MLDIKWIRENPEATKTGIKNKRATGDVNRILELDDQRRELLQKTETLKADRNRFSKEVNTLKREGKDADDLIAKTRDIGAQIKELDETLKEVATELGDQMDRLPNMPHSSVPIGLSEDENVEIKTWGDIPQFDFKLRDHMELGEMNQLFDSPRGSKIS
ncbi:MAG: serine--tRNA ligase, partial [Calditrichota bacterium]